MRILFSEGETTSLASSITKFRLENGRRYHALKDGSYTVPNDDMENERLDIQHYSCLLTLDGRLYTAPIGDKPLNRVLDGGCGIGNWTIDFADAHPETKVRQMCPAVRVDLSPVQSTFVPPNVEFFVDDIEEEWTYSAPFDFIYLRMLLGAIGDWPKLIAQAYRHTAPGGYVELMDAIYPVESDDGTLTEDSAVYRWNKLLTEAAAKANRRLDEGRNHRQNLIDAGFQNVTETRYKWPINTWPKDPKFKDLGAWTLENFLQGVQGFTLALFTRVLGWTQEEIELFLIEVRKGYKDRRIHAYWHIVVVHGQRPEEEAGAS
ncbi:unnamed protein product [Parascedosporium putredinis]|uniref:S-adenosyl-L-methionine-dependent methyltransferase n=1 Tax=Parascedosporium putredinis TaxID=1442378 RepID=A0A9P1HEI5_9PEZI|nr:unnamed protein product [Parascedosporium putredinis]CAI8005014.1 unnamed protein product [Parascedosporium putredinis]